MQVVRGGRRENISIYDIVVGDVIPLKIGVQVSVAYLSGFDLSDIQICFYESTIATVDITAYEHEKK